MSVTQLFITCPLCGVKHDLSFEVNRFDISNEGTIKCITCKKDFIHPVIKDLINKNRSLETRIKNLENPSEDKEVKII